MISINLERARGIAHDIRRAAREREFAPHDAAIAKQIPGMADQAEAARAEIRERYVEVQGLIDAAGTVDELKAALPLVPA